MAFAQPRRVARFGGALLIVAALVCGCVSDPPPPPPSDTETDEVVNAIQYETDDILSIDLLQVTDVESLEGCSQWHVQFGVEDDTKDWMGSAWYSLQTCIDDEEVEQAGVPFVKMTAKQVDDFRAVLARVGVNKWNDWLEANTEEPDLETPEGPGFTVSVLVDNFEGVFFDAISVTDTPPPEWDVFVAAIKAAAGDNSG